MSKLKTFSTFTARRRRLRGSLALGFVMILAIGACSADSADEAEGAAQQDDVSGTSYRIVAEIGGNDIKTLTDDGKSVVVVPVVESSPGGAAPIVWTAADPAEQIDFSWGSGALEVFAAEQLMAGGAIDELAVKPVSLGDAVKYDNEKFTADGTGESSDGIEVELSQSAVIGLSSGADSSDSPGPMVAIQGSGTIVLTPTDEAYIFVLENAVAGRVLGEIPSGALKVDMSANPDTSVTYDGATGQFTLDSASETTVPGS